MHIRSARFISSNVDVSKCPAGHLPEYAFIGRSNVGKSSLINMLTGCKNLAKTSATPGKTQVINHFLVNENWYLADLPGYGYAKVSQEKRQQFASMIENYLQRRSNLVCTFVLIDIRHEPQDNDVHFMNWMIENQLPFSMIFTKADKISATAAKKAVESYKEFLLRHWEEVPPVFISSARTGLGRNEILAYIEQLNSLWKEQNCKKK
ncbi:MAG: ribosome biogenesis GTP-binding protein YihA/YsxC [Cytophagales bacterium]|nr:ribosome biogenesis GTP-binding protein YihA/YsxC [Bernardetiaceae bacterium]MDW8210363.1 ribosome biogenesis GTP-binding protein YihA/YsxC [Cytophagales bacterium]